MAWLQATGNKIARILGIYPSRQLSDPCQLSEYNKDSEIPFRPDRPSPLIGGWVEEVVGSDQFQGLRLARKTIIIKGPKYGSADSVWRDTTKQSLIQDVRAIQRARHHHVIHLLHLYFDNQYQKVDEIRFAIIMDRADRNLRYYLQPVKRPDRRWFGCLLGVICYLHASRVVHGAIKPENILVKKGQVLLTDIGLSQRGVGKIVKSRNQWNPVYEYWAPEVRDEGISKEGDIFSLGAVFLEMFIVLNYPDKFESLRSILTRPCPSDGILSYASNIDQVHSWIENELNVLRWQDNPIRSKCKEMIQPDPIRRPSPEELDDFLPSLSAEFRDCTCVDVRT